VIDSIVILRDESNGASNGKLKVFELSYVALAGVAPDDSTILILK
jgi:hypothetical protein